MLRISCVICLTILPWALAEDKPQSQAEQLAAVKKLHRESEERYRLSTKDLPDNEEGNKKAAELWKAFDKGQSERFEEALKIAQSNPKSDDGFAALEWMLSNPRSPYLPAGLPAIELMIQHHAANPKIGKTIGRLRNCYLHEPSYPKQFAAVAKLSEEVSTANPDRTARGQAAWVLAYRAFCRYSVAEYENRTQDDVDRLANKAEKAFEAVVKDYGDCQRLWGSGDGTLADESMSMLYELRHLRVGMVAPEIEAEGVDSTKLKLSGYHGKVTVIVFWASWCGPCMAMVPHERDLVAKLRDRPFALIGVNGDDSREKAKEIMTKEKMVWPSFWNGPKGGTGPISTAWNVHSWPMVYLLDSKGVIRFKDIRGKELEQAIEQLLKELESSRK